MNKLTPTRITISHRDLINGKISLPKHEIGSISIAGVTQHLGTDFTLTEEGFLEWRGYALETLLQIGDEIIFHHPFPYDVPDSWKLKK